MAISFAVEQGLQEDPDLVGQSAEQEQDIHYEDQEYVRSFRSPDSDIWREEEQMYLEMTSSDQRDGQDMWAGADLDTSVEQESEEGQESRLVDQVGNMFPRCQYHIA